MIEPSQLKSAKEIIAYLKLQTERNNLPQTTVNIGLVLGDTSSTASNVQVNNICFEKSNSQLRNILSPNNDVFKNNLLVELPTRTDHSSKSDKNVQIISIINKLKVRQEQRRESVIESNQHNVNSNSTQTDSQVEKIGNGNNDKCDEFISDISGEIVRKSKSYYNNKENNKRRKIRHVPSSTQSNLTEFYNVVKYAKSNDNNGKCLGEFSNKQTTVIDNVNKMENSIEENKVPSQTSQLCRKSSNGNFDFKGSSIELKCKTFGGGETRESRLWSIFETIKKKNENKLHLKLNTNKETNSKTENKYEGDTTFDDICDSIINKNKNKLENEMSKLRGDQSVPRGVPSYYNGTGFLKSFSTGNILENIVREKDKHKDAHSLPITSYEIGTVNKELDIGNTTLDEFVERILKKLNNATDENSASERHNCETENSHNEMNKVGNEEDTNAKIEANKSNTGTPMNKKTQVIEYMSQSHNIVTENNKNCQLSVGSPLYEYNHVASKHSNKYVEISKPQFTQFEVNTQSEDVSHTKRTDFLSQKSFELINTENLENEEDNSKELYHYCACPEVPTSPINDKEENELDNSLQMYIDSLENDIQKSVLNGAYKQYKKYIEKYESNTKTHLDNFLNKIPNNDKKEKDPAGYRNNSYIKRYKKGKTKIYKIKKLRKKHLRVEEEINEDLNFHDLLKKISTDYYETEPQLSKYASGSSVTTPSSYITDETKSDVLSTGSKELTSPQQRLRDGFNTLSRDKSLCYCNSKLKDAPEHDKENIKMKIQDIFFQILSDFKEKKVSYLRHRRQSFDNCVFKDGILQLKPEAEAFVTVISSKARRSKAKFHLILYIMQKIQTLLENNTKLTKRELYYQLKALISDQRVSDRIINAVSCLLDVGMWALNITAQKGLVFGDLKLLLSSGEMLNCNIPGTLIPQDINEIVEVHSTAYFILVVEKESIFHKLIEEDLPNKLTRPFIMITGKGFPDLNTQLFLRKLWMIMSIPVFILVDADPHGINIMLNYRFGSVSNAHVSKYLAVPNAKWLGVYPSEVINLNIARQSLTERETRLVNSILKTPYMEFSPRLVEELNVLLTGKYKAGIEGLIKTDSYLSEVYLPNKFFTRNFI